MRRNWLVLLLVCLAVVMMAVLPGCRSKTPKDNGDDDDNGTITTVIGKAGEYNFKLADLAWEKVKEPVNASLSEMKAYDADNPNENEIETDPAENEPDFTKVSGGGVYIVDGNSKGNMIIASIKWEGDGDSVEDVFDNFTTTDTEYEIIQNGKIITVTSPASGLPWTAYCPDWDTGSTLAQVDKWYEGRIKLYGSEDENKGGSAEATFVAEGAYVYTIFTAGPEMEMVGDVATPDAEWTPGDPDKELDMTEGSVTIEFATDGISAYPAIIKLLIRDANGDWYLGGAPDEEELPPEDPVEFDEQPFPANSNLISAFIAEDSGSFEVNYADLSWEKVDGEVAALLSAPEGWNDYAALPSDPWEKESPFGIVIDPESTSPDLSGVTGGGLFINTSTDPEGQTVINGFKWEGDDTIEETFADASWTALVGHKQNAKLEPSPVTGFSWGGYIPVSAETNGVVIQDNKITIGDQGNVSGAYVYTVFGEYTKIDDYSGTRGEELTLVDMSEGTLTVDLTVLKPAGFKVLVMDANGDWYLGGLPQE